MCRPHQLEEIRSLTPPSAVGLLGQVPVVNALGTHVVRIAVKDGETQERMLEILSEALS